MDCSGDTLYRAYLPQRFPSPPTITAIDTNTGKVLVEKALRRSC